MKLSEYAERDAIDLAALLASGQVSPAEVADVARAAVEAVEPHLNATVGELFDEPLDYDPAGSLAGVPFALKDLRPHAVEVASELGSRLAAGGLPPSEDSDLMRRFRAAGLATIARTSAPEFGFNATTEPVVYGPTRNPWDTERSAGGSSGGACALVAAGALPVAHASDGGGSIRIPAACCGLVGLKPTRGRVPEGPQVADPLAGLGIDFIVSRTVRDTATMLDLVQGPGVGDKIEIAGPERPYADEIGETPGRLRVALSTLVPSGVSVAPECATAVESVGTQLTTLGHDVDTASPDYDTEALHHAHVTIWSAGLAQYILFYAETLATEPGSETLEEATVALLEHGRRVSALEYLDALAVYNTISRSVGAFFETVDVLVTPTIAALPAALGELDQNDPAHDADSWTRKVFSYAPFTSLFNVTGQPAISLPLAWSDEGPPVGVQLVAQYGDEATLIRLAAQLEQAMPWRDRRPAVFAA